MHLCCLPKTIYYNKIIKFLKNELFIHFMANQECIYRENLIYFYINLKAKLKLKVLLLKDEF